MQSRRKQQLRLFCAFACVFCLSLFVGAAIVTWKHLAFSGFSKYFSSAAIVLCATAIGGIAALVLSMLDEKAKIVQERYQNLQRRQAELQASRLALVKSDETEKRLLAADLHDQVLNDLRLVSQLFEQLVQSENLETAPAIRDLLSQVTCELTQIMDNLSPLILGRLSMAAAIEACLDNGSKRGGFEMIFRQSVEAACLERLSPMQQLLIYRLVQESVTNICKHAQASSVHVSIEAQENVLVFRILDNGTGLDKAAGTAVDRETEAAETSRGLAYMRLRASLINAQIEWGVGIDGKGTEVKIAVPLTTALQ